jgi:hypothetical protein
MKPSADLAQYARLRTLGIDCTDPCPARRGSLHLRRSLPLPLPVPVWHSQTSRKSAALHAARGRLWHLAGVGRFVRRVRLHRLRSAGPYLFLALTIACAGRSSLGSLHPEFRKNVRTGMAASAISRVHSGRKKMAVRDRGIGTFVIGQGQNRQQREAAGLATSHSRDDRTVCDPGNLLSAVPSIYVFQGVRSGRGA